MDHHAASLDALGLRFRTDKSSSHHDYLSFYERHFERLRDSEVKVLEVGVLEGASLAVWEEYFSRATVIGADIDPTVRRFARPRVIIEIVDQSNIEELVRLGIKHGPFDIIIEDGSHMWEHQITTLRTLFPFLRNGGIYAVEDLQTNFGALEAIYRGTANVSCVEYIKRLVDLRVADGEIDIRKEEDAFLRTYGRAMRFITFYRRACLIEKSYPETTEHEPVGAPFVPIDQDAAIVPLSLTAHIGMVGDKWSGLCWIHSTMPGQNVQGFRLDCPGKAMGDLLYRARHSDGSWTDWVGMGGFVGTRGKLQDLTGFSVRLGDTWRRDFEIEFVGAFRDQPDNVVIRGDGDCIPKSSTDRLAGMQVVLRPRKSPTHRNPER